MIRDKKNNSSFDNGRDFPPPSEPSSDFMVMVENIIQGVISNISRSFGFTGEVETLLPGKMLRTRFAARLIEYNRSRADLEGFARACAATELVHTASLCHDDVIDNGLIRRGVPSLWRATTPSCSVLIGDLLFSESVELLLQTFDVRGVSHFISKIKEVCLTEIEQEIIHRGKQVEESTCISIARGKTGPLFGYLGYVAGNGNTQLSSALEEAGYRLGTAYQLYDDLLDISGSESLSGKTLHTDERRGKFTLPRVTDDSPGIINSKISELCFTALESVQKWPRARKGLELFLSNDLQPIFDRIQPGITIIPVD